mgnify:CR=1 FL=1
MDSHCVAGSKMTRKISIWDRRHQDDGSSNATSDDETDTSFDGMDDESSDTTDEESYTNLNDEEKKGIMEFGEEEKKYVIFFSADLVFVRVPLPRCSTDAFKPLFPFLFFRSRARRLNAGEQRLFEVDEKFFDHGDTKKISYSSRKG